MKGTKIDVLDHGFVRLVDCMGDDLSIVRAARVSYDAAWRAGEDEKSDTRLLNYMMRNGHTSPFEAVEFQFEVMLPIFVVRQWHRHRTWSYSELSARYRELPEMFYLPKPEHVGTQSKSNKQARDIDPTIAAINLEFVADEVDDLKKHCEAAFAMYRKLLSLGWPRELARMALPFNTYTHMFAKVDLHNLLGFLSERLHPHAQWEIQQYAQAILTLIEPVVPVSIKAWRESRA